MVGCSKNYNLCARPSPASFKIASFSHRSRKKKKQFLVGSFNVEKFNAKQGE